MLCMKSIHFFIVVCVYIHPLVVSNMGQQQSTQVGVCAGNLPVWHQVYTLCWLHSSLVVLFMADDIAPVTWSKVFDHIAVSVKDKDEKDQRILIPHQLKRDMFQGKSTDAEPVNPVPDFSSFDFSDLMPSSSKGIHAANMYFQELLTRFFQSLKSRKARAGVALVLELVRQQLEAASLADLKQKGIEPPPYETPRYATMRDTKEMGQRVVLDRGRYLGFLWRKPEWVGDRKMVGRKQGGLTLPVEQSVSDTCDIAIQGIVEKAVPFLLDNRGHVPGASPGVAMASVALAYMLGILGDKTRIKVINHHLPPVFAHGVLQSLNIGSETNMWDHFTAAPSYEQVLVAMDTIPLETFRAVNLQIVIPGIPVGHEIVAFRCNGKWLLYNNESSTRVRDLTDYLGKHRVISPHDLLNAYASGATSTDSYTRPMMSSLVKAAKEVFDETADFTTRVLGQCYPGFGFQFTGEGAVEPDFSVRPPRSQSLLHNFMASVRETDYFEQVMDLMKQPEIIRVLPRAMDASPEEYSMAFGGIEVPDSYPRRPTSPRSKATMAGVGSLAAAAVGFGVHRYMTGRASNQRRRRLPRRDSRGRFVASKKTTPAKRRRKPKSQG